MATALALGATAIAVPAAAAPAASAPVYPMEEAVVEHVYVQTAMDSDRDGRLDLVRADIVRPAAAPDGTVPSIITASGYNGTPGGKPYLDDANRDTSSLRFMPGVYDNYFVPRGYAYLSVDVAGTNWSEGCVDNVGPNDVESVAAVIRWLHGEPDAIAYRQLDRAELVDAPWSSGRSAVTGISYDGGIANAVATSEAVPGLETVIPIAGGTSAYNTRPNGVHVGAGTAEFSEWLTEPEPAGTEQPTLPPRLREHQAQKRLQCQADFDRMRAESDPQERTYNAFWQARNYTDRVDQIAANGVSVFTVMGQGDMIVRTNEFDEHWAALQRSGVESKLWLHQRGHIDPFDADRDGWMRTLHDWLDHELLGIDNGATGAPAVRVELGPDAWTESDGWPVAGSTPIALALHGGGEDGVGRITTTASSGGVESFVGAQLPDATPFGMTGGTEDPQPGPDRLIYVSEPFETATRISGTPSVSLQVAGEASDMNISAALVDYGPGEYVDWTIDAGVEALPTAREWGESTEDEGVLVADTRARSTAAGSYTFSRGTASLAHHETLTRYTPAAAGEMVQLGWDLYAADHVIAAGHRLGVILYNNSVQLDPGTVGNYVGTAGASIDLAASSVTVPVVGLPRKDWASADPMAPADPAVPAVPAGPLDGERSTLPADGVPGRAGGSPQAWSYEGSKTLSRTGADAGVDASVALLLMLVGAGALVLRRGRNT